MHNANCERSYFAHITADDRHQSLAEHLNSVAKKAAVYAEPSGMQNTARIAGLLHDAGKGCSDFQEYLVKSSRGEQTATAFPHSRGGARYILDVGEASQDIFAKYTSELIAAVIMSHHSDHDFIDDGNNIAHHQGWYMDRVLYMNEMQYGEISSFADSVIPEGFSKLFEKACREVERAIKESVRNISVSKVDGRTAEKEIGFVLGMLMRTVLACVIKADHEDTSFFVNGYSTKHDIHPDFEGALNALKDRFNSTNPTPINICRQSIADCCGKFGNLHQAGIYTLEVPTGSGKTMATQRLALECAVKFQKSRIITVMPMLSIIEQNALDIRNVMGEFCEVREFHSDIIADEMNPEQQIRYREVADTWNAPVIITTLVQLLETCFKTRSRNLKRFAALQNSVILIDEVQSVPPNILSLFNSVINYMAENCQCLVILCTATQPNLQILRHPIHIQEGTSVVEYDENIWSVFRRTDIIPILDPMTIEGLAKFAKQRLRNNLLIICNTRSETRRLYGLLKNIPDCECIKIDTNLCPAHRKTVIDELRKKLSANQRLICIATQVIEAGVDVSFEAGIRVMAGLENAIQAAGRINRHGEKGHICPLWIVNLKKENLSHLKEIGEGKMTMLNYLTSLSSLKDVDLTSPDIIEEYYRRRYLNTDIDPDFITESKQTIYDMLSLNEFNYLWIQGAVNKHVFRHAFKSAGESFKVFDDTSVAVIVPYGRGEELIDELNSELAADPYMLSRMLKEAEQYAVKLFDYQKEKLEEAKAIYPIAGGKILAVMPKAYDAVEGLLIDGVSANA